MKILDRKLFGLGLVTALCVVVLDQVSKAIMVQVMASHPFGIAVLPVFSLVSAWNTGVSFSMLRNAGPWVLSGGAILVSLVLLAWLTRIETLLTAMGIGCVAGGAIGNVIDRLRAGAVFDFLDFYIRQADGREWHWPAFNLADSGITVGVVLLLIDGLFHRAGSAKSKAS